MLPKIKRALSELIAPIASSGSSTTHNDPNGFRPTRGDGSGFVRFGDEPGQSSRKNPQKSPPPSHVELTPDEKGMGDRLHQPIKLTLVKRPEPQSGFSGPQWQSLIGFLSVKSAIWLGRLGKSTYREILKRRSSVHFKKGAVVDKHAA